MPQDATHSSPSASLKDSEDLAKNADNEGLTAVKHADDALLAKLGYQSVFKREFSVSPVYRFFHILVKDSVSQHTLRSTGL